MAIEGRIYKCDRCGKVETLQYERRPTQIQGYEKQCSGSTVIMWNTQRCWRTRDFCSTCEESLWDIVCKWADKKEGIS